MKKHTPLPLKITIGSAAAGIILLTLSTIKELASVSAVGVTLTLIGFFGSVVVSLILDIKKTYSSRGDPFQRKMRVLSYIRLIAGFTSFLSVALVMYGLYNIDNGTRPIMNLGLTLIVVGIAVTIVISVVMSVIAKVADPQFTGTETAIPSADNEAMPQCSDPVISRILANPYVLLDERIRQLHEVQNLLQYPEIQQIFFEPTKLYELFPQDRVGELLDIVSCWITRNNAGEIFAAAEKYRPAGAKTVMQNKQRTKPVKKNTTAFAILFIAVWLVIFIAIFSSVLSRLH